MTARYIEFPCHVCFSEKQIDDIINMAKDPFCPETMTAHLVYLAVKSGEYVRNLKVLDASED